MARKRLNKITQPPPNKPIAKLRDGSTLTIGDLVETDFHEKCAGVIFEVCEITPFAECESGSIVLAHVQGHPERKLKGFEKDGYVKTMPDGLDANHFKKIKP